MIGLSLALLLSSPDQEAGSRIRPTAPPARPSETRGRGQARLVMHDYARCVVLRNRPAVERFLAVLPGAPDETRLGSRIATNECLSEGALRFAPALFRGALYEQLYRSDFVTPPPSALTGAPKVSYGSLDAAALTARQRGFIALQQFGDCVVRARPEVARKLILSGVGSPGEGAAITEISPALGPCLSQGMQVDFSRPLLRGALSESIYRLSVAARNAVAARGN